MVLYEDTVFAPIFWGFVGAIFLTGVTVVQAYVYFPNSGKDAPLVRWTAVFMLIMDLASTALLSQSIYYYLIPEFGSFAPMEAVTPELTVDCLISAIITFISQLYFVYQLVAVRKSGKGNWITIWVTIITAVLGFAGGLGCVGSMFKYKKAILSPQDRSVPFKILFSLAKGWASLADIVATVAMCLWLADSKTGIKQTNTMLGKLMVYTLQRGVLVTSVQTLILITFWAKPTSLAWFALHMEVTKLYVNTFFAMLNGRNSLREKGGNTVHSNNPNSFGVLSNAMSDRHVTSYQGEAYTLEKVPPFSPGRDSKESEGSPIQHPYSQKMPTITRTVVVADV